VGFASLVGPTVLHSPADRNQHELDVVVVEDEAEPSSKRRADDPPQPD